MNKFQELFKKSPAVIGMIHVKALPGTPRYRGNRFQQVIDQVKKETDIYLKAGVDGLLIENMHDIPYTNRVVGPEITASMTAVSQAMKEIVNKDEVPCGIQILAGCNKEALAVAKATHLDFIRAEGFVFTQVADEGMIQSDAGELLRYRKTIDAENVLVFTDIKKKHSSHAITSDLNIEDIAKAAEFFLSDGLIITGSSTGKQASTTELETLTECSNLPILIGSGITSENCSSYNKAHGFIIGSYFKDQGYWENEINYEKVKEFMIRVNNR